MNQQAQTKTGWRFERLALKRGHWLQTLEAGPQGEDAPTLLLVHGAAGSWHNFRLQIQWLQRRYRVISLDLRGHGVSPWPGPSRIEDFVDDLQALVERKIRGPFAVVGHSFGGCLATHLTVRLGQQVRGLALLNTSGHLRQGLLYRFLKVFARFSHWVAQVEPYWVSCHGCVAHTLLRDTLPSWNTWDLLPQIKVPTLVLSGRHDLLMDWRDGKKMSQILPAGRYHRIDDGRHVCMWESPRVVEQQLESWLAEFDLSPSPLSAR